MDLKQAMKYTCELIWEILDSNSLTVNRYERLLRILTSYQIAHWFYVVYNLWHPNDTCYKHGK